ncbi:hypothetical protein [Nocardia bovistercoris]|uniref:Uncharacterized protein n=1 Tax=Nocardia bovistercoris TaxID=2785916 RepID=A0A931N222_9NOCA|nr:hypothetical protein [Nocardia bovistercoris]MBH0775058.1 hypothetical protein [Nocardia bovistercoris]
MRIIRPDDNHDHNDDHHDDDGGELGLPESAFTDVGDEAEEYLAQVLADIPPPDTDEPPPAPTRRPATPLGPKRPALHLVAPDDDPDPYSADQDTTAVAVDPDTAIRAGQAARRRMVRGAAGGSAVVVAAAALAGWGEPVTVTGPLALYGTGWVAFLWWNAALRPSIPDTGTAVVGGIGHTVTTVFLAVIALARAGVGRLDSARSRQESQRTATEPTT